MLPTGVSDGSKETSSSLTTQRWDPLRCLHVHIPTRTDQVTQNYSGKQLHLKMVAQKSIQKPFRPGIKRECTIPHRGHSSTHSQHCYIQI